MTGSVHTIQSPDALHAIANPIRIKVLESLRDPASAAAVARRLGHPRQKVNYHLKELQRVGLVEHAGERRKGNFVEQLYQAVARRFVISPSVMWDKEELAEAVRDQVALSGLLDTGERIQRHAAALLDRAASTGARVPSTTMNAEVGFEDESTRNAFMNEYLSALTALLGKYGDSSGERFVVTVGVYPDLGDQ